MTRGDIPDRKGIRITLHGRVQGVGFRYWTMRLSSRFDVAGWVRNEPDGSVTIECEGPASDVEAFLSSVKKGPPGARVDRVDSADFVPTGRRKIFTVEY